MRGADGDGRLDARLGHLLALPLDRLLGAAQPLLEAGELRRVLLAKLLLQPVALLAGRLGEADPEVALGFLGPRERLRPGQPQQLEPPVAVEPRRQLLAPAARSSSPSSRRRAAAAQSAGSCGSLSRSPGTRLVSWARFQSTGIASSTIGVRRSTLLGDLEAGLGVREADRGHADERGLIDVAAGGAAERQEVLGDGRRQQGARGGAGAGGGRGGRAGAAGAGAGGRAGGRGAGAPAAFAGAAGGRPSVSRLISVRVIGPRRYDIAHRVSKTTGASSWTLLSRKIRLPSPARSCSIAARSKARPGAGRRALEALEDAGLVPLGLESADEPGAGVGEALVVEVHRVLGGQHDADPERPGLLEQGQQRPLGGRVGDRREVAEDLVHVEEGPEARRPGLGAGPAEHLARAAARRRTCARRRSGGRSRRSRCAACRSGRGAWRTTSSGSPGEPRLEAGRGQQVVQRMASSKRSLAG